MSVLRRIEDSLESAFERGFRRAFKSQLQPVELARKLAREMDLNKTISVAKVYVAQAAKEICDDAIQVLGGYGYMTEYPVEARYREVRGGSIYGGTMQIHKNMIASHILGRKLSQWPAGTKE